MNPFRVARRFLPNLLKMVGLKQYSRVANIVVTSGLIGISSYLWFLNPDITTIIYSGLSPSIELPTISNTNNFFIDVNEKCSPSVLAIEVYSKDLKAYETGEPKIISTGSGFVVKEKGWIITNAHVVINKPCSFINVVTNTGDVYPAELKDIDLKYDLALLKINDDTEKLEPLMLAEANSTKVGEWVVALGSPLALRHSITAGIVSSINREGKELGLTNASLKYIQTDATITFGHSGGPLVNLKNEVVGVNNLKLTAGISFAIPIVHVREFIEKSILRSEENERIQKSMSIPKYGIITVQLSNDTIKNLLKEQNITFSSNSNGVLVWNLTKNSFAAKAGLMEGDIITHINNSSIESSSDFYKFLGYYENKDINFTIYRNGVKTKLKCKIDESNKKKL